MSLPNIYQFVPSEDGEFALFIYAREGNPDRPLLRLMPNEQKMELYLSGQDMLPLNIDNQKIFEHLQNKKNILICEVLPAENENEIEIIRSYLVDITQ